MRRLIATIILLASTTFLMIGCQYESTTNDSRESFSIIKGFKSLEESFIDHEFIVKERPESFTVEGKYDLNYDGEGEQIALILQKHSDTKVDTYIEVNGIKQEIYMSYTYDGEVKVIDLDKNDKFIEIAYFDEGPSGDPEYNIYRYDGSELFNVGHVDDNALVNGEGKIIPSMYISDFEPAFYSAWLEVKDNTFIIKEKNIEEYLEKEYTLNTRENSIYFVPMEDLPENFNPEWSDPREFETTTVTLIDVIYPYDGDNQLNYYFVELSNGEKGILYFWIGD